jgi:hypothetical protein
MKQINDVYKERLTNKNYKSNLEGRYKLDYLKYKFYLSEYLLIGFHIINIIICF